MALHFNSLIIRSLNRSNFILGTKNLHGELFTPRVSDVPKTLQKLASTQACETFIEKNERLKRPLSPHLTIYKFPLPAVLSISHRTSGIILGTYAGILGISSLALPGGVNCVISMIDAWNLSPALLYLLKYFFALPATFHFFNGIRHLTWDLGMFLSMKDVYSTGYGVISISIATATALSVM